jgi:hypothetical protein
MSPASGVASPEPILRHLSQHLQVKYVMAGSRLGVFEALYASALDLAGLANAVRLPVRSARILANALISAGLLVSEEGRYRNAASAQALLAGGPGQDLRPLITMWDRVVERQWTGLVRSLQSGKATCGWPDLNEEEQQVFASGIEVLTAPAAHALAECYDFSGYSSLLDLAGGTGSFLSTVRERYPTLRATLLERPEIVARFGRALLEAGINVVAGDLIHGAIPGGFDVVLIANAMHLFSPEANQDLLRRIRTASAKGTRLLLVDFWMDEAQLIPELGALLAGEFLIVSGGDVYSADEVRKWLSATDWRWITHRRLAGAASLIEAEAAI